ncbi:hypothetical protein A3C23_02780 [Candidatus Roizmanbacteria bacterium RIFCSPHIGHO2_02_FULL_37_13b]|uniref:UDP-N-acetyl-alpha-D-muramoyl-L-alanyl-L-glutamate epimerase n=1 Tax=Candidatus Roizmanbacteria bacterium RIFCSPLOWO2_02_FULL_36_11 TaxID=1802071 RepID=A0A1F7JG56_9BACT|nr:MAG: hypothetical protein A3C23_02780 [Candidatus Roizmanbacteria bacterium RIFCSPHIGHO2_02_FULL_37_13b]OGK54599.1 MAG: hypothetical protein A3H78_01800 [Candidatus Roizmanbacteria bacterium RIFCSPLOWO2_02_FULL_36_11]
MRTKATVFEFVGYKAYLNEGKFEFYYKILFDDGKSEEFVEKLRIASQNRLVIENSLDNILQNLLLMLGISYYKLYCPKEIKINGYSLTSDQAKFWNTVYTKGLGEFFYKNKIDFHGLVNFPYHNSTSGVESVKLIVSQKALVPFGGGKDSIVTAQILKEKNIPFETFTLNTTRLQQDLIKLLNVNNIIVMRELDPKLFVLNEHKGVYNGHIPITAIYSFVAIIVAYMYGFNEIVMSNEKSASFGNVEYLGSEINHQWSKSEEFERLFHDYINKFVTGDINYYSLLRPFYEIEVIHQFVKWPQYFPLFSSCNVNFQIKKNVGKKKWCGSCAKCCFIFTLMSSFISKNELIKIFKENLFAKTDLIHIYRELLGLEKIKPFECVGTPEETMVAFYAASRRSEYKNDIVMQMFEREVYPKIKNIKEMRRQVLSD